MSKPIPPVRQYMTAAPHTVPASADLAHASRLMREHRIRHLPVLEGSLLVGIVSERDIALIETLRDVDPEVVTVADAMTPAPYTATPETPLDRVAAAMAEHKYGATIVVDGQQVVGIFTSVDACAVLVDVLNNR